MKILGILLAILLAMIAIPSEAQVQPGHGNNVQHCDSLTVTALGGTLGAGTFHYCVIYPETVTASTARFNVVQTLAGPPVLGAVPSAVRNFFPTGCVEVSNSGPQGVLFQVFATQWSWVTTVDMTSTQCRIQMSVTITSGAFTVFGSFLNANIRSLDYPTNERHYLCDATETATVPIPVTECDAPNLRTYLCDAVITEPVATDCTAPSIFNFICRSKPTISTNANCDTPSIRNYLCDASDYALVGGDIPPSECTTPHIALENLTVNATVMGNVSINQTNLPEQPQQGFDGSLYILVCIMIAVMIHLGQSNKNKGHYAFAGFLSLVAGFVLFWELDRTGFNNLKNGVVLAGIFMFMHVALASYLFYLFATDNQEEPENK